MGEEQHIYCKVQLSIPTLQYYEFLTQNLRGMRILFEFGVYFYEKKILIIFLRRSFEKLEITGWLNSTTAKRTQCGTSLTQILSQHVRFVLHARRNLYHNQGLKSKFTQNSNFYKTASFVSTNTVILSSGTIFGITDDEL